jgi:hypothetical protein
MCDKCRQLETDIQRYRKRLEQSDPLILELQRSRKLLALGLDPLTMQRVDGVIRESVHKPDKHRFSASLRQEGRRPPGACDPLRRSLLARALREQPLANAALFAHERVVSVDLAGKSRPGAR